VLATKCCIQIMQLVGMLETTEIETTLSIMCLESESESKFPALTARLSLVQSAVVFNSKKCSKISDKLSAKVFCPNCRIVCVLRKFCERSVEKLKKKIILRIRNMKEYE